MPRHAAPSARHRDSGFRRLRRLFVGATVASVAVAVAVSDVPANAATTPLTVQVVGAQNYGSAGGFIGYTSVSGVTASGITCTTLTNGQAIAPTLPAGSYTIDPASCSGGTMSNPAYSIKNYTGSTYTVYRVALTVTADSPSRPYNTANPTLTYALSGFVNGDTAAVVTGAPTLSTTATKTSSVGDYPITVAVGTLRAANYSFTPANGTLHVLPAVTGVGVAGAQTYGSTAAFVGYPSTAGVTVSGVTCTTLTNGRAIDATLPVGRYTIDGTSCSGGTLSSSNYSIGSYTGGAYTVVAAALTVRADDQSRAFNTANPTLTYTITGFQNGDDASAVTGAPALSTTAVKSSPTGSYPISISAGTLASPNYTFTYVPGTLTVNQATAGVSVIGAQIYGSTSPGFVGYASVGGVTVSGVTCTTLTDGESISSTLPAGTYTIDGSSCSGGTLSNENYAIGSYTGSTYTVYRATLTVTADNQARAYRTANPALTYSVTGFVNGEDATVLTGSPALSTTATSTSDVGSYPITVTAGSLRAANYVFTYVPGTLTVTQAAAGVAVVGAQNYGSSTPGFVGYASVGGVGVSGVTCTTLTNGQTISSTLPAGSYTIDGSSCSGGTLSNANYAISSYTGSTFTVYRATLTVTANDATRTFGAANPVFGYTVSGFVNGDDSSVVTGSPGFATPATKTSDVGTYPITVSAGSLKAANYAFTFVAGTLTVTLAPLTVAVVGAQNYGGSAGFVGYASVSGVGVSGVTCTGLTNGSTISPDLTAGSYTIDATTCSGGVLTSGNYRINAYSGASYRVYPVQLTVTADNASRTYGAANPAFTYKVTGFVHGDDASSLTGSPALSTTATASSGVGSYPITVTKGSLASPNYTFTFVAGTLTVTPATLTVTADDKTMAYGNAVPALTATTTGFVNGDTSSVLTGSPTLSTTATSTSVPGSYPISISTSGVTAANYTVTGVPGTLTVTQATPTITTQWNLLTSRITVAMTYGPSAAPVVGVPVTAVVNGTGTLLGGGTTDSTGKVVIAYKASLALTTNGYTATSAATTLFASVSVVQK